jgi:hypothetical protein
MRLDYLLAGIAVSVRVARFLHGAVPRCVSTVRFVSAGQFHVGYNLVSHDGELIEIATVDNLRNADF